MNFGIYQTASQVFFGVKDLQSCFLQFNKRNVLVKIVIWTKSDGCFLKGWYIFTKLQCCYGRGELLWFKSKK